MRDKIKALDNNYLIDKVIANTNTNFVGVRINIPLMQHFFKICSLYKNLNRVDTSY